MPHPTSRENTKHINEFNNDNLSFRLSREISANGFSSFCHINEKYCTINQYLKKILFPEIIFFITEDEGGHGSHGPPSS